MARSNSGRYLNQLWNVGAEHALYIHDGHWYHHLKRFPGALFDRNGYIVFETEEAYRKCSYLNLGKQVSIKKPGISGIPGYVRVVPGRESPDADVDIHATSTIRREGRLRLVTHLQRERDERLVRLKKKSSSSLACEICGFSFAATYGSSAADYCEAHHLVPLSEVTHTRDTSVDDLAILCVNCHRVIHLRNPPYALDDVREMISVT